jgi:DNA-binding response OmpR family regulator
VILLTAKERPVERLLGLRAGSDDFLVKPLGGDELTIRIQIAQRILGVPQELERLNFRLTDMVTTDGLSD